MPIIDIIMIWQGSKGQQWYDMIWLNANQWYDYDLHGSNDMIMIWLNANQWYDYDWHGSNDMIWLNANQWYDCDLQWWQ